MRREYEESTYNELWRTVPRSQLKRKPPTSEEKEAAAESATLGLPQENLLYFLEKHAPKLDDWKRELFAHRAHAWAVFLSAAPKRRS